MGARIGIAVVIVVVLGIVAVLIYFARKSIVDFITALLVRKRDDAEGSTAATVHVEEGPPV
ncbi:hypothetical protein IMZ48_25910 [Candidatus Bathyarchaeota archaeon]|nr:hypothetical protein [Candidatus Bathyarchaeota archaeon]